MYPGLPVLRADDVLHGHPFGPAAAPPDTVRSTDGPAAVLRAALLPALRRSPCVVAFSGGRDSSVVLAVAAEAAARAGLAPPVALTLRYPGDPAAEESAWQELVLAHLAARGLRPEWVRRDVTTELDLIGPLMRPVLRRHGGPTFPPALAPTALLTEAATGGALVTGNFGDEVMGGHRAAVLRSVWRRRGRRMTPQDRFTAALAASPARLRRRLLRSRVESYPWLRPPVAARAKALLLDDVTTGPLRCDLSVRAALRRRAVEIGRQTRAAVARVNDCLLVEPLGAPEFVDAYARAGGRWGATGRAAGLRLLAGDLLPEPLVTRTQKAYFNASRFGQATREFARGWDGTGLDPEVVDHEALRRAWTQPVPPAASALLLQQAWVVSHGGA